MSKDPASRDYQTDFIFRFKAFVAVADRDKCNQELEAQGFGPDNFATAMVGSGDAADAEPTHYGTDWQCTADEYAVIEPILLSHACKIVKQNESDKKVIESNVPASDAKAGQAAQFDTLAADAGLKVRVEVGEKR